MMRAWVVVALVLSGCRNDARAPDAAPADAPVDSPPDAIAVSRCELLCDCMVAHCEGELEACLQLCATLDTSVRECRYEHCNLAISDPTRHCPHARGEDRLDTPRECLQM